MTHVVLYRSRVLAALLLAVAGLGFTFAWRSASGEWDHDTRIGTFQLRSEVALGENRGQGLLREMARLRADVESALLLRGPGRPIQVNLFQSRESYLKFLQQRVPEVSNRSAVYVQGMDGAQIYVCHHDAFERDVRHECTHAVIHQSINHMPLWLDEGIAEYFEVPAAERSASNPYLTELRELIDQEWAPDLNLLEEFTQANQLGPEDYRECWAWAHFLLHGPLPAQQRFQEYLQDLAGNVPAGRLGDRLRACLPDMDVQLINHLRQW